MSVLVPLVAAAVLLLLQVLLTVEANPLHDYKWVQQNGTSPWLNRVTHGRPSGCWRIPWICHRGEKPPRIKRLCCKNRCVDVTSDPNNCGRCGARCRFTWQCCRGICINTNFNRYHCGRCGHKCPLGSFCFYGMCGYAQPLTPFPFPSRPPFPPKPFPHKPPKPQPPFPPNPFPPKPPKPQPPFQPPMAAG